MGCSSLVFPMVQMRRMSDMEGDAIVRGRMKPDEQSGHLVRYRIFCLISDMSSEHVDWRLNMLAMQCCLGCLAVWDYAITVECRHIVCTISNLRGIEMKDSIPDVESCGRDNVKPCMSR